MIDAFFKSTKSIGGDFTPGNLVRFGFHSCVTGCDGCLNLQNPASAGLEPSWNALLSLYTDTTLPSNITWYVHANGFSAICDFEKFFITDKV